MFEVNKLKSLNDLELEVYRYVVNNIESVKNMKIRELADQTFVSTNTILRFCKKMDCNGYAEFKVKLKMYLDEEKETLLNSDMSQLVDFFKKTSSSDFEAKLNEICEVVLSSKRVIFLGSGMSGIIAKYGARYFSSVGIFSTYIDEPHYPTDSPFTDNTLVFVLSISGESNDILSHVTRFKRENCQIISITNSQNCTLAKLSNINISNYIQRFRLGIYDITSQIPTVSIIERLGINLYNMQKKSKI